MRTCTARRLSLGHTHHQSLREPAGGRGGHPCQSLWDPQMWAQQGCTDRLTCQMHRWTQHVSPIQTREITIFFSRQSHSRCRPFKCESGLSRRTGAAQLRRTGTAHLPSNASPVSQDGRCGRHICTWNVAGWNQAPKRCIWHRPRLQTLHRFSRRMRCIFCRLAARCRANANNIHRDLSMLINCILYIS